MKKNNEKIKVVKSQSFIVEQTPELCRSLTEVRMISNALNEWVNRKPQDRAALVMALEGDKLCFYRMSYTKKFAKCDNPDLAYALHLGCVIAGSDASLYAALCTATKFCKESWDKFQEDSAHGKD